MIRKKRLLVFAFILLFSFTAFTTLGCNTGPRPKPDKPDKSESAEPVSCNWTIHVNDTVTVKPKGLPINYTLKFVASKNGGDLPMGTYKGTATLTQKADFGKIPELAKSTVIKVGGGVDGTYSDNKINLTVGWTTKDKYANIEPVPLVPEPVPLVPVKPGDIKPTPLTPPKDDPNIIYVGEGALNLSGKGNLNVRADAIGGEKARHNKSVDGKTSLSYFIKITDANVEIVIPGIGIFKGAVTGDPI